MKGEFLTKNINIRVTQRERDAIQEQAEVSGLSISEYIRRRVYGRYIPSRIEKRMLSELRRQGGLLKYILMSHKEYTVKKRQLLSTISIQLYAD